MSFDPAEARGYKSRNDRKDAACTPLPAGAGHDKPPMPQETCEQTYERKRRAYTRSLQFRISETYIGAEGLTWTPTLTNRDAAFQQRGRETLIEALKRMTYAEREALAAFIGDAETLQELELHGKLPPGLKDHWKHPVRGGGSLRVDNVCLMTVAAHDTLKGKRIDPAIHAAYADVLPDVEHYAQQNEAAGATRLEKIELFAASFLANPRYRRVPFSLIRPLQIGIPAGIIAIGQADFDLRADLQALEQMKAGLEAARPRRARRAEPRRQSHRPGSAPR